MYRTLLHALHEWKQKSGRKPLIIRGARQVGKTWVMKEFGKTEYQKTYYLNFDSNAVAKSLFEGTITPDIIIPNLELYFGEKINPENSLLIFDEIQEVPRALTSLKYFSEDAFEYHIVCAGSLLGVALHEGTSFPVGKVEFLDLYPLSYTEFLRAIGKEQFADLIDSKDFTRMKTFREIFIQTLKSYYYVGGMPEVVQSFVDNADYSVARSIQQRILDSYDQDLSKHAPAAIIPRIRLIKNSIPAQLAKENKKFIYGIIKEGARAKDFELALLWLLDYGFVAMVNRVTAPRIPLKAYEDFKAFKLFVLDIGLLSCMVNLESRTLVNGDTLFSEFKGALTEQFVFQQLRILLGHEIYYWTNDRGTAEIDFLTSILGHPVPIEVKAETNLKSKSLKAFREKFSPAMSSRLSLADFEMVDGLANIPLYSSEAFVKILSQALQEDAS